MCILNAKIHVHHRDIKSKVVVIVDTICTEFKKKKKS